MDSHSIDIDELLANEPWLRRLASALVAPADVDDLVQQTLSSALTQTSLLVTDRDGRGSVRQLRAWLGGVARNLARQAHRSKSRRQRRERIAAQPEALPSTAAMLGRLDAHQKLAEVVRDLGEPYRSTLLLRFYEELPAPEIAKRLGVPASTVRTRIERGLTRLRDRLDARNLTGLLGVILSRPPLPEAATAAAAGTGTALLGGATTMTVTQKFVLATLPVLAIGLGYWLTQSPATKDPGLAAPEPTISARAHPPATSTRSAERSTSDAAHSPAAPPPKPDASRRGLVVDPRGRPLANAPIVRYEATRGIDQTFSVDLTGKSSHPIGTSNHEGRFEAKVDALGGVLTVGAPFVGLASHSASRDEDGEALIVAARSTSVRGTVIDSAGVPVGGVVVFAIVESLLDYPGDLSSTSRIGLPRQATDRLGQFVLNRVPALPELELRVFGDGYREARAYDVIDRSPLTIQLRKTSPARRYRLSGTVVDPRGQPVSGALVRLGEIERKSNRNGVFRLSSEVLSDEMRLIVAKTGHQPIEQPQVVRRMLTESPQIDGLRLRLGPAPLAIRGRVLTPNGEPVEGLAISLLDTLPLEGFQSAENLAADQQKDTFTSRAGQSDFAEAHTNADGRFTIFGLRDTPYRFRVFDHDTLISKTVGPLRPNAEPITIEFDPAAQLYTLRGTTRDSRGRPLARVRVFVTLCTRHAAARLLALGPSTRSNDQGEFELHGIPPGDCRLGASRNGLCDQSQPADPLRGRSEVTVTMLRPCRFRAEFPATVRGRIELLDSKGQTLELSRRHGAISMSGKTWSVERGKTPVLSVPETAVECVIRDDGKVVLQQPVQLDPERTTVLR